VFIVISKAAIIVLHKINTRFNFKLESNWKKCSSKISISQE
jgi:hypothetical protein